MTTTIKAYDTVESFAAGDNCPAHNTEHRKIYTFGSSMSAETEVCTFKGCRCAVAVKHDPVGTYASVATYHESYDSAAGSGKLRSAWAKAYYR